MKIRIGGIKISKTDGSIGGYVDHLNDGSVALVP